jgi:hypothetical protein
MATYIPGTLTNKQPRTPSKTFLKHTTNHALIL